MALLAGTILVITACAAGNDVAPTPISPAPTSIDSAPTAISPAPTPTPIGAAVETPDDAAALVIASDPRFAGAIRLRPDVIGASRWWEAEPLEGGGYRITVTIGWGDCPAGCISRHTWTFDVSAGGNVTLIGEAGDPLPAEPPG